MADAYQLVDGFNNTGTLVTVDPQPRSTGIQYPRVVYAPAGTYADGSAYTLWIYESLTRTQFNTLRTAFGLSDTALFNDVTIKTLGNDNAWVVKNARIEYIPQERDPYFWKNVEFRLYNLEATA